MVLRLTLHRVICVTKIKYLLNGVIFLLNRVEICGKLIALIYEM